MVIRRKRRTQETEKRGREDAQALVRDSREKVAEMKTKKESEGRLSGEGQQTAWCGLLVGG